MYKKVIILVALCLAAPLAALEWHIEAIDGLQGHGRDTGLALDGLHRPRIAYVYDNTLTYARWDGSGWSYDSIYESYDLDGLIDLALDDEEYPHFVYCLFDIFEPFTYYIYTYIDGSGQHDICVEYTLGFEGIPYMSIDLDSSQHTHISFAWDYRDYAYWDGFDMHLERAGAGDIAVDGDDRPCIATGWDDDELTFMVKDGGEWSEEIVDSGLVLVDSCSIALDSLDRPHIVYYEEGENDLRYAYRDGSWHVEILDSEVYVGRYCSLALDSNDEPHIAYYANTDLIYVYRDGGEWHREVVDSVGNVCLGASLALDEYDRPHISYNNYILGAVMYAALVEDLFHL
ncbi:hypothetical protein KAU45_02860, partial [bacterium]|nr:hypothetical protein [bacterium]